MRKALTVCLLLLTFATSAQDTLPSFTSRECPYFLARIALESDVTISCGTLLVAEDRQALDSSRMLELFVARIAARFPSSNAPIVFLDGGPGSAASQVIRALLDTHLHLDYEIIVVDQRGTGLSRPSLNCQERDDQALSSISDWIRQCYRRLSGEGIALHAYNSANNANDIHELLVSLEIVEANIYGISYGSRLALTLMRDFPQRIRAVILDAVVPPQANILDARASAGYRAIDQIFLDCARDLSCNRAYPNLRQSFYDTVARLNREPAEVYSEDAGYQVEMTGDDFIYEVHAALYQYHLIPFLPALINAYADGDYDYDPEAEADDLAWSRQYRSGELQPSDIDLVAMDMLAISDVHDLYTYYWDISETEWETLKAKIAYRRRYQPFQEYLQLDSLEATERHITGLGPDAYSRLATEVIGVYDSQSEGMQFSVQCAEEVHFNNRFRIRALALQVPKLLRQALMELATDRFSECEIFQIPQASERENQPVVSDIPVLLLSGNYDPISPPNWAAEATAHLENSWHYVLPDMGHGTLFTGDCIETVMLSFLVYPQFEPRAACLADLSSPKFIVQH